MALPGSTGWLRARGVGLVNEFMFNAHSEGSAPCHNRATEAQLKNSSKSQLRVGMQPTNSSGVVPQTLPIYSSWLPPGVWGRVGSHMDIVEGEPL